MSNREWNRNADDFILGSRRNHNSCNEVRTFVVVFTRFLVGETFVSAWLFSLQLLWLRREPRIKSSAFRFHSLQRKVLLEKERSDYMSNREWNRNADDFILGSRRNHNSCNENNHAETKVPYQCFYSHLRDLTRLI